VIAIKAGNVGRVGATGAVLDRSLIGLRNLVDRFIDLPAQRRGKQRGFSACATCPEQGCVFTLELPRHVIA
jgi:hypothetical protein